MRYLRGMKSYNNNNNNRQTLGSSGLASLVAVGGEDISGINKTESTPRQPLGDYENTNCMN